MVTGITERRALPTDGCERELQPDHHDRRSGSAHRILPGEVRGNGAIRPVHELTCRAVRRRTCAATSATPASSPAPAATAWSTSATTSWNGL